MAHCPRETLLELCRTVGQVRIGNLKSRSTGGGGAEPRWRDDGRQLFYISRERALMAVPVESRGEELMVGQSVRLFGGTPGELVWHFEPAPGGQRLFVLPLNEEPEAAPLHLLTGWQSSLR